MTRRMPSMRLSRKQVAERVARFYTEKFGGAVWCRFDPAKRAYQVRGESLKPHPDLAAKYPNGWTLLDHISPSYARLLAGERYSE